jgi:uncharacterized protein (TIGR00730 family)
MVKSICVFCSSSDALDEVYYKEADKLAELLLKESVSLVYGGARVGIMGQLAKKVIIGNGHVTGVVPESIFNKNIADDSISKLIVTEDMKSRKALMAEMSDAFIALPGGFGTLEELLEIITLKQLEYHQKPIVIINTDGFYDILFDFFEVFYSRNFAKRDFQYLFHIAQDSIAAMNYLKNYKPGNIVSKWYKANLNL